MNKPWSDDDEINALHLAMRGFPRYAIAACLKRSSSSVGAKLRRLWKRGDTWLSRYDASMESDTLRKRIGLLIKSDIRYPLKKKVDALVREGYTYMEAIDKVLE